MTSGAPHLGGRYYERVHGRYTKRPAQVIECIPKFGFGTTHEIADADDQPAAQTSGQPASTGTSWLASAPNCAGENESGSSGCSSLSSIPMRDDAPPSSLPPLDHHEQSSRPPEPKLTKRQFQTLVLESIDLGVRHFDCAPLYRTQALVGECLKLATKLVPRQDFFITSKLPPNMMRGELASRSITTSIKDLQCNYLDLFLIHAPFATRHIADDQFYPRDPATGQLLWDDDGELLEHTWRQVAEFKRRGLTRYVGLSNVNKSQIERLQRIHPIDVVQNEYHLYNQDRRLFDYCDELDIHYQSYATFGSPAKCRREGRLCAMDDPLLLRIASEHQLTPAQVVIMWAHTQPMAYVVRNDTTRQLEENFRATFSPSLSINQLIELDAINMDVQVHLFREHAGIETLQEYPFKEVRERPPEFIHPPHREDLRKYYMESHEQVVVRHESDVAFKKKQQEEQKKLKELAEKMKKGKK